MIGGKGYFRWGGQGGGFSGRQKKPRTEELNYDKHDKSANRKERGFHAEGPAQAGSTGRYRQFSSFKNSKTGWLRAVKKDHREGRGQVTWLRGENFRILFKKQGEAFEGF